MAPQWETVRYQNCNYFHLPQNSIFISGAKFHEKLKLGCNQYFSKTLLLLDHESGLLMDFYIKLDDINHSKYCFLIIK